MDMIEKRLATIARTGLSAASHYLHGAGNTVRAADNALFKLPLNFSSTDEAREIISAANRMVAENKSPVFTDLDCKGTVNKTVSGWRSLVKNGCRGLSTRLAVQKAAIELADHAATIAAIRSLRPQAINEQDLVAVIKDAETHVARVAQIVEERRRPQSEAPAYSGMSMAP